MDRDAPPPGFGLSLIALIACRVITSVITFALAPVVLVGMTFGQAAQPDAVLAHAAAFLLLSLVVNILIAALILRMLIGLLGAYVSLIRAIMAILIGGMLSGALAGALLASHASVLGLVLGFAVGLILTAMILSGGHVNTGKHDPRLRYQRPPTAPPGWPGTD